MKVVKDIHEEFLSKEKEKELSSLHNIRFYCPSSYGDNFYSLSMIFRRKIIENNIDLNVNLDLEGYDILKKLWYTYLRDSIINKWNKGKIKTPISIEKSEFYDYIFMEKLFSELRNNFFVNSHHLFIDSVDVLEELIGYSSIIDRENKILKEDGYGSWIYNSEILISNIFNPIAIMDSTMNQEASTISGLQKCKAGRFYL